MWSTFSFVLSFVFAEFTNNFLYISSWTFSLFAFSPPPFFLQLRTWILSFSLFFCFQIVNLQNNLHYKTSDKPIIISAVLLQLPLVETKARMWLADWLAPETRHFPSELTSRIIVFVILAYSHWLNQKPGMWLADLLHSKLTLRISVIVCYWLTRSRDTTLPSILTLRSIILVSFVLVYSHWLKQKLRNTFPTNTAEGSQCIEVFPIVNCIKFQSPLPRRIPVIYIN